jgi:MarR family transcriptional regulator, organic hydroperoxide resistance regulator
MKTSCSKFAQCLYFASAALARKIEKLANESWKEVGLSPSHAYLLLAVLEEPGLQQLEEKKLVIRTTEGRLTNVYPTPKAKELQPKMTACMQEFSAKYIQLLGKEESTKLVQNLARVADKLDD